MTPTLLLVGLGREAEHTFRTLKPAASDIRRCSTARQARIALRADPPDLLLIQVGGSSPDEWSEAERLVESAACLPTLVLVESPHIEGRLAGFAIGADDVISLPCHSAELNARLEALLRRQPPALSAEVLRHAGLQLSPLRHEATVDGQPLSLTPSEFELLELLLRWPGQVFTREQLVARIHHASDRAPGQRAIDVLVAGLRRKLQHSASARAAIETVRGVGYRLGP